MPSNDVEKSIVDVPVRVSGLVSCKGSQALIS